MDIKGMKVTSTIEIPSFDVDAKDIKIEVRRPNLIRMMAMGEIPNPLMGAAYAAINGYTITKKEENLEAEAKRLVELTELYCTICMVKPTYEEINEYMTDEQRMAVLAWATTPMKSLRRFRTIETDVKDSKVSTTNKK